jgi:hypothetical protein
MTKMTNSVFTILVHEHGSIMSLEGNISLQLGTISYIELLEVRLLNISGITLLNGRLCEGGCFQCYVSVSLPFKDYQRPLIYPTHFTFHVSILSSSSS